MFDKISKSVTPVIFLVKKKEYSKLDQMPVRCILNSLPDIQISHVWIRTAYVRVYYKASATHT